MNANAGQLLLTLLMGGVALLAFASPLRAKDLSSELSRSDESRWVNLYAEDQFRIEGMTGILGFSREGSYAAAPNEPRNWPHRDTSPHPFIGLSFRVGALFQGRIFDVDLTHEVEASGYARGMSMMISLGFLGGMSRGEVGADAKWRFGTEDGFAVLWASYSGLGYWNPPGLWGDPDTSVGFTVPNLRIAAGGGTWVERGISVEVNFVMAHLFKFNKWAIGGEFLLSVHWERLRIMYLTQFDRHNALGPRPYLLIAYEWRSVSF